MELLPQATFFMSNNYGKKRHKDISLPLRLKILGESKFQIYIVIQNIQIKLLSYWSTNFNYTTITTARYYMFLKYA